jgi:large subunit ribosomal protein L22
MLEVTATSKYLRTSAQKAGLVLALIRGKKAADALSILHFTNKSVARDIEKTLRSAIANAVNVADRNQKRRLDEDDLVVSRAYANQGPSQKRVRPAPMGRAYQTIKRTTHISVVVVEGAEQEAEAKAARTGKAAAKTARAAKAKSTAKAGAGTTDRAARTRKSKTERPAKKSASQESK